MKIPRPLVLATASEARRKLVSDLGLEFSTTAVDIDETCIVGEHVRDYVKRLAIQKSAAVLTAPEKAVIITVDTAIGLGSEIIGKPTNEDDAKRILKLLSGKLHDVVSAICVRDNELGTERTETTLTEVEFSNLSDEMVDWYLATDEWRGRAGAYAIQGKGITLVKDINGCLTNVIGISIPTLIELLMDSFERSYLTVS